MLSESDDRDFEPAEKRCSTRSGQNATNFVLCSTGESLT